MLWKIHWNVLWKCIWKKKVWAKVKRSRLQLLVRKSTKPGGVSVWNSIRWWTLKAYCLPKKLLCMFKLMHYCPPSSSTMCSNIFVIKGQIMESILDQYVIIRKLFCFLLKCFNDVMWFNLPLCIAPQSSLPFSFGILKRKWSFLITLIVLCQIHFLSFA